jgi:hypothetical protein
MWQDVALIYAMPAGVKQWNRYTSGLTMRRVNSITQDETYLKKYYASLG